MEDSSAESAIIDEVDLSTAWVGIRRDGIIRVKVKDDVHIAMEQSRETFEAVKEYANGRKSLVLVLSGNGGTLAKEARDFSITKEASEPTLAEAVVAKGLAHKIIVNFLIRITDVGRPMKMFTKESDAVSWLGTFRSKLD